MVLAAVLCATSSLLIASRASSRAAAVPRATTFACASDDSVVNVLETCRTELCEDLSIPAAAQDEISSMLCLLHAEEVAPRIQEIYSQGTEEEERVVAIEELSRKLDLLEEKAKGPLLSGSKPTIADAMLFPSFTLFELTLPSYFGWEEWTEEAIFYRRPRLHAWFELFSYERAAKAAKKAVSDGVASLDLSAMAVEVPTSRKRKYPRHTS